MKETKVYVDELPIQCLDCRFTYGGRCQAKENGESYCVENCRRSDCPLIDIKTHDRELVRQVCEKIMHLAKLQNNDNFYIMTGCIIDEIRKKFEMENEEIWLKAEIDTLRSEKENLERTLEESAEMIRGKCTKWQKLKEWVKLQIDGLNEQLTDYDFDSDCKDISIDNFNIMLQQMQELEGEE